MMEIMAKGGCFEQACTVQLQLVVYKGARVLLFAEIPTLVSDSSPVLRTYAVVSQNWCWLSTLLSAELAVHVVKPRP